MCSFRQNSINGSVKHKTRGGGAKSAWQGLQSGTLGGFVKCGGHELQAQIHVHEFLQLFLLIERAVMAIQTSPK